MTQLPRGPEAHVRLAYRHLAKLGYRDDTTRTIILTEMALTLRNGANNIPSFASASVVSDHSV
jgi:hypothetical protein